LFLPCYGHCETVRAASGKDPGMGTLDAVHQPASFDLSTVRPANFGRRFGALLIDWALCLLVAAFYADPRVVAWPPVLVLIVLNAVGIGLFGRTPGMALAGLRCISIVDGGAIGLPKGLLRAVLLALLIPAIIMDPNRRGLHDRAADSVVVLKPEVA